MRAPRDSIGSARGDDASWRREQSRAALSVWGRRFFTTLLLSASALACRAEPAPKVAVAVDTLWLDAAGQPNASAQDALRLLADAGSDGLAPQAYRAADLAKQAAALAALPGTAASPQPAFDGNLDASMRRFLHDLHLGRVDPRALGFRVARPGARTPDFAALLRAAAVAGRLPQLVAELRPQLGQYAKLREALARYRALAVDGSLRPVAMVVPAKRGATECDGAALRRLLIALGDLAADAAAAVDCNDPELVGGLKRFQSRHGMTSDGMVGKATLLALNAPLPHRVLQLELALERLRWLPDLGARPFVAINIPMFRLWAWDPAARNDAPIDMGVVVGRALNTQTPVMAEDMHHLVFRPYWNLPRSIVRNEVLPAIARDPGYLTKNDMEMVRGAGDDALPVASNDENLAALRQGGLRLRQRPGPKNSLGLVKFIFPNDANIYLHDTPATQLFGRARRDFSHGCVRVEDPVGLAHWVLRNQPGWTRERIEAAMAGSSPLRVDLTRPLPVILFYMTAMAVAADQTIHFADDIYGHDAKLVRALSSRRVPAVF